jgi:general secretion pathway protein K
LVSLSLFAFIVTEIIAAATLRHAWEAQRSEGEALRSEAFSALEATLGVLGVFARIDGALHGPAQGWAEPLQFAEFAAQDGVSVSVSLHDESGYYGLASMASNSFLMRRFLQDLGIPETQAQMMAASLADWVDADNAERMNGAERDSYPEGIAPPNRPLQRLDELRHVRGWGEVFFNEDGTGNELFQRFAASVSLLGNSATPNINTAPQTVLEILATRHAFDVQGILSSRDGSGNLGGTGSVFRNAADLGRVGFPVALANSVSFSCTRLRVITRATKGSASIVVDTLLSTGGGGDSPPPTSGDNNGGGGSGMNASPGQFPFTILQQRVNALLQD